jgi:hypothetical protein
MNLPLLFTGGAVYRALDGSARPTRDGNTLPSNKKTADIGRRIVRTVISR